MSTKPLTHAEWDTNGTNLTPTSAGHKSDGWANNEVPTAGEFNHWMNQVSNWTKWLYDGDCAFNSLSAANFTVTGSTTYTGIAAVALSASLVNADPLGTGVTTNLHAIHVDPTAATWSISGLVGGVNGREIEIINVETGVNNYFTLVHEASAATAANRFTFPFAIANNAGALGTDIAVRVYPGGAVRLKYDSTSSRWRVTYMTGCRVLRELVISAASAEMHFNSSLNEQYGNGMWTLDQVASVDYPITLPNESIIDSYRVWYKKDSNAPTFTLSSVLNTRGGGDGSLNPEGPGDSDNRDAPGFDILTESFASGVRVVPHVGYHVTVSRSGGAGGNPDYFYNCAVKYWDLI